MGYLKYEDGKLGNFGLFFFFFKFDFCMIHWSYNLVGFMFALVFSDYAKQAFY